MKIALFLSHDEINQFNSLPQTDKKTVVSLCHLIISCLEGASYDDINTLAQLKNKIRLNPSPDAITDQIASHIEEILSGKFSCDPIRTAFRHRLIQFTELPQ